MNKKQTGCFYGTCTHPGHYKGFCIFHLPKKTDKEKRELSAEEAAEYQKLEIEFREKFFKLLKEMEDDPEVKICNFQDFQFVEIDFSKITFEERFWEGEFKKSVDFSRATFAGRTYFQFSRFNGEAEFHNNTFNGEAEFVGATFTGFTNFYRAIFNDIADFREAIFAGGANFRLARFTEAANFIWAEFAGAADFTLSTFSGEAELSYVKFAGAADFILTEFVGKADFNWATFRGKVFFRSDEKKGIFKKECYFREINKEPEATVVFEKVNLKKTSFLGTDIENFEFRAVKWCFPLSDREKKYFKGSNLYKRLKPRKNALYDESRSMPKDSTIDYSKLADNYRQLVLNYERKRNFERAMEFRVGEMEVKRKSRGTSSNDWWRSFQQYRNSHALYKLLSHYGTNYWQAFWVLLTMLVVFSVIFMFSGFETLTPAGDIESVVNYNISFNSSNRASFCNWCSDFGKSCLFTLSILTLQKGSFYAPEGGWSQFWLFFATIAFYSQAALLLLAIRRRFKQ